MAIKININLAKIAKEFLELGAMRANGYREFFSKYKLFFGASKQSINVDSVIFCFFKKKSISRE